MKTSSPSNKTLHIVGLLWGLWPLSDCFRDGTLVDVLDRPASKALVLQRGNGLVVVPMKVSSETRASSLPRATAQACTKA
eukprot:4954043-Amphidinium_carterae.3